MTIAKNTMRIGRKAAEKEILGRVGEKYLKKNYGKGTFDVEDNWIIIKPAPSFIDKLLEFFR